MKGYSLFNLIRYRQLRMVSMAFAFTFPLELLAASDPIVELAPDSPTVTVANLTNDKLHLEWSENPNDIAVTEAHVVVEYDGSEVFSSTLPAPATSLNTTIANINSVGVYTVRVKSCALHTYATYDDGTPPSTQLFCSDYADDISLNVAGVGLPDIGSLPKLIPPGNSSFVMPAHDATVGALGGSHQVGPDGSANYSIPIEVPPGAGGIQPELAITYNSNAGNGLLGLGWDLSGLSSISRCPMTLERDGQIVGVDFDNLTDQLCLDGERMVLLSGVHMQQGAIYSLENENYSKIEIIGANTNLDDPYAFRVSSRDGKIIEYGNTEDSRIEANLINAGRVHVWAISKVGDRNSNSMVYKYEIDQDYSDYRLDKILYGSGGYVVKIVYSDRSEAYPKYFQGSYTVKKRKLEGIVVETSGSTSLVSYNFTYSSFLAGGISFQHLSGIEKCGNNECLSTTSVDWVAPAQNVEFYDASGGLARSGNFGSASSEAYVKTLTDVNGDGVPDFAWMVTQSDGAYIFTSIGKGDGSFEPGTGGLVLSGNFGSASSGAYVKTLTDVDGDGIPDFAWMVTQSDGAYIFISLGNGDGTYQAGIGGLVRAGNFGTATSGAYDKSLVDINDDGVLDFCLDGYTERWRLYLYIDRERRWFISARYRWVGALWKLWIS